VYILTNKGHTTLYIGYTTDIRIRVWEHKNKVNPGSFTAKYNVNKLVYHKAFDEVYLAKEAEAYMKGKTRAWKSL
jgi:putative endonuclease